MAGLQRENDPDGAGDAFLGLGFSRNDSVAAPNSSERVMQETVEAMMRECLAYHEAEESRRGPNPQQRQKHPHPHPVSAVAPNGDLATQFVPATVIPTTKTESSASDDHSTTTSSTLLLPHHLVSQGQARARAIVARFVSSQQQQQQQQQQSPSTLMVTRSVSTTVPPTDFAEQRRVAWAHNDQRQHAAFCKNLDYILTKERARIQALDERLAAVKEATNETNATVLYQHQLAQRNVAARTACTTATSSSGATTTTTAERCGHKRSRHATSIVGTTTVAIYVAGLPTGSDLSIDTTEAMIHSFFGSYGTISKLHFYRDKTNGHLKGDCLVIYSISEQTNRSTVDSARQQLIQTVCTQMNGAELPSGHVLRVEPGSNNNGTKNVLASTTNAGRSNPQSDAPTLPPSNVVPDDALRENAAHKTLPNDRGNDSTTHTAADDLDEFFDSL